MRLYKSEKERYLYQSLPWHKSFEMGYQWSNKSHGFRLDWRINSQGDHAGFRFRFEMSKFFFEINLTDTRHWSYKLNRFLKEEESCPDDKDYCE